MARNNKSTVTKTADYSADINDDVIQMDASGGARTVTLPSALFQQGNTFTIVKKDSSANAVTVQAAGSSTINGGSNYVLTRQHQEVVLQSDGTSDFRVTSQSGSGKAAATVLTPGATVSIDPTLNDVFTLTPGETETINAASVGQVNTTLVLIITTSGVSSFTLTFGTNFKSSGTLATGTVTAKKFLLIFRSDGTSWLEQSRTAAL